ncbi:hypothetical protein F25303_9337 [Fusarium sp. NRRL 25303]|nr:hypothetical protein F25303_9337 [Fusarium sp. NRRL 25303]
MERQAFIRPDLENAITDENEHLLPGTEQPSQHRSLQQFSGHADQRGPDVYTETHELQQWRSTIKNTQIGETQILLEEETEVAGLISPLAQGSGVSKPQWEEDYRVTSTQSEQNNTTDQKYDINTSTRLQCVIGVFIGGLLALACIGSGIYVLATRKEKLALHVDINTTAREVLSLVFNIILTFCIDSMAFAHSVSLRWALYREHKLEFNTNLRLFTNSTKSGPNRWSGSSGARGALNMVSMDQLQFCIDLEFQPIEQLSGRCAKRNVPATQWEMYAIRARSEACVIATLRRHRYAANSSSAEAREHVQAKQAYKEDHLAALDAGSTGYRMDVCHLRAQPGICSRQCSGSCVSNTASLSMSPSGQSPEQWNKYPLLQVFLGLLFLSTIQATQSVALHCTELLVNISRDEKMWRNAYSNSRKNGKGSKGSLLASDSLKNAIRSWEYIILSLLKSVLHWSVGQAIQPAFQLDLPDDISTIDPSSINQELTVAGVTFYMIYPRLLLYAVLAILLASFASFLALRKRSGPQPATMGHLQTIADLVDDWTPSENGRIYWGDKGENSTSLVRHAGTSFEPKALGRISPNSLYAG